ncbi:MAG: NAD(P)/FAD-dependent oxidoreductase [Deltaproteobacteria bacterium]|nr:MAG: NAD(P)/FAD-dependent oxidoreductase [Deltaproteobacteria bacterium]
MNRSQTIVILGGGVGGVVCAVELRKKLPKQHRVVLVDREERHLFAPSLLWLMIGQRTAEKISRPLDRLRKKGIDVMRGEIQHIEPAERHVTVSGESITADHLIISLGADLAPETIPGLAEAGHNFYTLEGAEGLRDALGRFRSGKLAVLTATPAYKCPAAPYEAAMLLEYHCRKQKIREQVQIDFYAAEPGPMGVAGKEITAAVRQMVEDKGIGFHPEHQITQVNADDRKLTFANGAQADFDLLAYVPPHRPPRVVKEAGLVGDSGWVSVDRHTMETEYPGVYALGDVVGIPLAVGKPLPKAGVFAHGEAVVVAQNIVRCITGKAEPARFDGHGECFIETGDGKAGFGRGNFYGEPLPQIKLHKVGRRWHAGKILFEKYWLRRWF